MLAIFGGTMPYAGVYLQIEPHPLCWATGSSDDILGAIDLISEKVEGE